RRRRRWRGATWKRPVRRCLSTVSTTCSAEPVRRLAWLLPLLLAGAVGALRVHPFQGGLPRRTQVLADYLLDWFERSRRQLIGLEG
ncbi:hypothetical protein Q4R47_21075, partial [Morganella morganii]